MCSVLDAVTVDLREKTCYTHREIRFNSFNYFSKGSCYTAFQQMTEGFLRLKKLFKCTC